MNTQRTRVEQEARPLLRIPRPIRIVQLQTTYSDIDGGLDAELLVMEMWVANITGSAATFSVSLVPDGGTASSANAIAQGMTLAANNSIFLPMMGTNGFLIEPGYTLEALCSVNDAINIGGWGYEYSGRYD